MAATASRELDLKVAHSVTEPVAPAVPARPVAPAPPSDQVSVRQWIGVLGALLGAFMAVLDIQITNASLKDITGALGATLDEGSWISTSYLTTEIIIIPLSAWLASIFSVRNYLLGTAALFLFFSTACGFAWNLQSMVVFRAFQGFTGGALIPMAFQIILTNLPPAKRPMGFALFGITATFAPSIGPTVGGWLTENYGWPLIFFINLVPGAMLIGSTWFGMDRAPMDLSKLRGGDWWGVVTMSIGLACLTVFLEEGERKDWFGSLLISRMAIVAAISLTAFLCRELWYAPRPLLNLRLLARRNFAFGTVINVGFGVGLYASSFVLPLYLAQMQGYNSLQIGRTIMWAGLPQLVIMPLVPSLMKRFDSRLLIAVGLFIFGFSCMLNYFLDADVAYDQLRISQTVRALGAPLVMVPLSALATGGIEPANAGSASGLFNMMRNLGGSMGIALTSALLTQREHLHSNRIGEHVGANDFLTHQRLQQYTHNFIGHGMDPLTASRMALGALDGAIRKQAFLQAYGDCFFVIGATLFLAMVAVFGCKKVIAAGGGAGAH
jgi:DHA2 family multidrug resistance protein